MRGDDLADGAFPTWDRGSRSGESSSGWLSDLGELPYHLRGDADDLPNFDWEHASDTKDLVALRDEFKAECGEHRLAEERRLAYVAFTRARRELFLTASWWGTASRPRGVSPFLAELAEAELVKADLWAPMPEPDAENPRNAEEITAVWPAPDGGADQQQSPAPTARDVLRATAGLVDAAAEERLVALAALRLPADALTAPQGVLADAAGHDLVDLARMLLAERNRRTDREVAFPAHVSASGLVRLAADRDAFALQLRRPVPVQPTVHARRGTRFHEWVEQFFTSATLLDVDDLPSAEDDDLPEDTDLDKLRDTFLGSEWSARMPVAVEVDVETPVAGVMLRCRMDAVFKDPATGPDAVVVVDWKTGREPLDASARAAREVQLAVYRLAWSRWTGLPLDQVSAAFYYVGSDTTVRPDRLLDEAELEALIRGA